VWRDQLVAQSLVERLKSSAELTVLPRARALKPARPNNRTLRRWSRRNSPDASRSESRWHR